jgi:hypothetical protein
MTVLVDLAEPRVPADSCACQGSWREKPIEARA